MAEARRLDKCSTVTTPRGSSNRQGQSRSRCRPVIPLSESPPDTSECLQHIASFSHFKQLRQAKRCHFLQLTYTYILMPIFSLTAFYGKEDNDWVKKCIEYDVDGARTRGDQRKLGERLWKKTVRHVN